MSNDPQKPLIHPLFNGGRLCIDGMTSNELDAISRMAKGILGRAVANSIEARLGCASAINPAEEQRDAV